MALYSYQALARNGKKVSGTLDAPSISSARELLVSRGLYPVAIQMGGVETVRRSWRLWFSRTVSLKDKIFLTKQLSILLKSGVPLLQALELLGEQSQGYLQTVIIELRDDIKEGMSLAGALERYPKVFDATYVQLVRAGEASGRLEIILDRLALYLERRQEIASRVRKALSYPLFQLGIMIVIVGILLTFVVPQISETFASEGAQLPWATRFLMNISYILTTYYIVILVMIIALYIGYRWFKATSFGRRFFDTLKLKVPVLSYFVKMGTVVQFSRTLGMLVEGGVNLAESLFIVCNVVENRVLTDTLNDARDNIIKHGRFAEYLKKTGIFPSVAIYLINTGEQSGQLGSMLITVAEYYERELSDFADSLSSKLGPLMTLVMALLVGFIIMAIVMPLIQTMDIIGI